VRRCEPADTVTRVAAAGVAVVAALLGAACLGSAPARRPAVGPPIARPSPGRAVTVAIEVFGTAGTRFGGSYGDYTAPRTIEGTVPARLAFESRQGFSVALQKRAASGELGMEIMVDGRRVKRVATTRPYGALTHRQAAGR
jgi:hypothetical protein